MDECQYPECVYIAAQRLVSSCGCVRVQMCNHHAPVLRETAAEVVASNPVCVRCDNGKLVLSMESMWRTGEVIAPIGPNELIIPLDKR